jgi:hypothetical protein
MVGTCTHDFYAGTTIVLTATDPQIWQVFDSWNGGCASGVISSSSGTRGDICTIVVNDDLNISPNYVTVETIHTYLDSNKTLGHLEVNGVAQNGASVARTFVHGSEVTIVAIAAPHYHVEWTGCDTAEAVVSPDDTCTVTLNSTTSVRASFVLTTHELTVEPDFQESGGFAGDGSVTTTYGSIGISCPEDCDQIYSDGVTVNLRAVAAFDSTFEGWTGCDSVDSVDGTLCTVNVTDRLDSETISAAFAPRDRNALDLTIVNGEHGTVTLNSADELSDEPGVDGATYNNLAGRQITLTSDPDANYHVVWTGCESTPNEYTCTVSMASDVAVSAEFVLDTNHLTVTKPTNGTITTDDAGINCGDAGNDCEEWYDLGASVHLIATGSPGYVLSSWGGACSGGVTPCTVTMSTDRAVSALFAVTQNAGPVPTSFTISVVKKSRTATMTIKWPKGIAVLKSITYKWFICTPSYTPIDHFTPALDENAPAGCSAVTVWTGYNKVKLTYPLGQGTKRLVGFITARNAKGTLSWYSVTSIAL